MLQLVVLLVAVAALFAPVILAALLIQRWANRWRRGEIGARQFVTKCTAAAAASSMASLVLIIPSMPAPGRLAFAVALVVGAGVVGALIELAQLLLWYDVRHWGGRLQTGA